jgi:hypothetical protein
MRKVAVAALSMTLMLVPLTSEASADNGKGAGHHGRGGSAAAHGQQKQAAGARSTGHADLDSDKRRKEVERVAPHDPDDRADVEKVGICHATGAGSYVFISVSEDARGHREQHGADVEATGADACPETPASPK